VASVSRDHLPVQQADFLAAVIEPDQADVNVGAIQDSVLVRDRPEDPAGLLDPLQDVTVRAAANALRGKEARPPTASGRNVGTRLFEPRAMEIGLGGDPRWLLLAASGGVVAVRCFFDWG
jgi:hypothetical protein